MPSESSHKKLKSTVILAPLPLSRSSYLKSPLHYDCPILAVNAFKFIQAHKTASIQFHFKE